MTQQPLPQEQLLTAINQAIDLYQACQPIEGRLPSSQVILSLLQTCGVQIDLAHVKMGLEIVFEQVVNKAKSGQVLRSRVINQREE